MILVVLLGVAVVPPAEAQQVEAAEISDLLQRRAEAVRSGDVSAFLATSAGADPFLQSQRRSFEGLDALKVKDYALAIDTTDWPDLTREKDRKAFGDKTIVAYVSERYRIDGYDAAPVWNDLFLTFGAVDGGWKVVADDAVEDLGLLTSRQVWDFGSVNTKASQSFLLIFHPAKAEEADPLLALAEEAAADVPRVWPGAQIADIPIVTPSDKPELKRILGATFDVSNFVAFASSSFDEEATDGWELVGHRIILNPVNFARHAPASRRKILAHELVHVATRPASGPFIPAFVDEGIAELTDPAGPAALRSRARAGRFDRRLPQDWEFVSGGGDSIYNSYLEAASAIDYMKKRWGIAKVQAFYSRLGFVQLETGTGAYHLDAAMREVLSVSSSQFETAWADSVSTSGG